MTSVSMVVSEVFAIVTANLPFKLLVSSWVTKEHSHANWIFNRGSLLAWGLTGLTLSTHWWKLTWIASFLNRILQTEIQGFLKLVLTSLVELYCSFEAFAHCQLFISSSGTTGKASSPPPVTDTRQMSEKLETILYQLRQVTRERDELRKQLALSSPGSTFDDCR